MKREAEVVSEVDLRVFKALMGVRDCRVYMGTRASRVVLGSMEGLGLLDFLATEVNRAREASLEQLEPTATLELLEPLAARVSKVCKGRLGDMEILASLACLD